MAQINGNIFQCLVHYILLEVIVVLLAMLIFLILLNARNRIMDFLKTPSLRHIFSRLCDFSDRLDENYMAKNPYGSALWLTRLIREGIIAAAGLIGLYILVIAISG